MAWFDYAVLTLLALSLLVGALRGIMREIVSVVGWVAAFVLASAFAGSVAAYMPESLGPLLSGLLAFMIVFIGVLALSGAIGLVLSLMIRAVGFGLVDRTLGAMFGAVRGVAIVLLGVLLAGLTPLPREPFWTQAVLSGPFEAAALTLRPFLPDGLADRLKYR